MPFDSTPTPVETTPEVTILDEARALIATPDRWTKGHFHDFRQEGGYSYCVLGALRQVQIGRGESEVPNAILYALVAAMPRLHGCIATYNDADQTTHADILALFDDARNRLLRFDRAMR